MAAICVLSAVTTPDCLAEDTATDVVKGLINIGQEVAKAESAEEEGNQPNSEKATMIPKEVTEKADDASSDTAEADQLKFISESGAIYTPPANPQGMGEGWYYLATDAKVNEIKKALETNSTTSGAAVQAGPQEAAPVAAAPVAEQIGDQTFAGQYSQIPGMSEDPYAYQAIGGQSRLPGSAQLRQGAYGVVPGAVGVGGQQQVIGGGGYPPQSQFAGAQGQASLSPGGGYYVQQPQGIPVQYNSPTVQNTSDARGTIGVAGSRMPVQQGGYAITQQIQRTSPLYVSAGTQQIGQQVQHNLPIVGAPPSVTGPAGTAISAGSAQVPGQVQIQAAATSAAPKTDVATGDAVASGTGKRPITFQCYLS
jgi:hypothetical protein